MRRANGSGQIFKIKGAHRRNPWRVRITVGWEIDEVTGKSKQIIKTLGYYPSRHAAEVALTEYLEEPYNIGNKDITFAELYKEWSEQYLLTLSGMSSVRTVESAYKYIHTLYNIKVRDIRVRHLEGCLQDAYIVSSKGSFIPNTKVNDDFQSMPVANDFAVETEKLQSKPVSPKLTEDNLKSADADFGAMVFDTVWNEVKNKSQKDLPVAVDNITDLGSMDIGADEANFRSSVLDSKITPVVQEKVTEAVHQTVALNNDRMKISMTEVLDEYNSDRIKELKKDRKQRQRKKRFWGVVKFGIIFVIISVLMTNAQIRTRVGIIFQDTKKLVVDIFNDEPTTSNNVAGDFFDNLGTHLNEVNIYEVEEIKED